MMAPAAATQITVQQLRQVVNELIEKQEYKSALFWADKIVCLSSEDPADVLTQARCLYHLKEYHRAVHCIKSRSLHLCSLSCRHLVAKCHVSLKLWFKLWITFFLSVCSSRIERSV